MSTSMWLYREGVTSSPDLTHPFPHWTSSCSHSSPHHTVWCLCQCLESSRSPAACAPALSRTALSMKKVCRYFCKLYPCLVQRVPLSHSAYPKTGLNELEILLQRQEAGVVVRAGWGRWTWFVCWPLPHGAFFLKFFIKPPRLCLSHP